MICPRCGGEGKIRPLAEIGVQGYPEVECSVCGGLGAVAGETGQKATPVGTPLRLVVLLVTDIFAAVLCTFCAGLYAEKMSIVGTSKADVVLLVTALVFAAVNGVFAVWRVRAMRELSRDENDAKKV